MGVRLWFRPDLGWATNTSTMCMEIQPEQPPPCDSTQMITPVEIIEHRVYCGKMPPSIQHTTQWVTEHVCAGKIMRRLETERNVMGRSGHGSSVSMRSDVVMAMATPFPTAAWASCSPTHWRGVEDESSTGSDADFDASASEDSSSSSSDDDESQEDGQPDTNGDDSSSSEDESSSSSGSDEEE